MVGRNNLIIAIIILFLAACGDTSFLPDLSLEDNTLEITSHHPGSFLTENENMAFKIKRSSENIAPLNIDIRIYSIENQLVGSLSIENIDAEEEITLAPFSFLTTGYYKIVFDLIENASIIQEANYQFFYIEGNYSIKSIETHPSTVSPDSPFILKSLIDSPAGSDPYLRWSMNNEVIAEGLKSQGWNNLLWTSPKEEGVYSLILELFPVAPLSGQNFKYKSDITMEIEIYVIAEKGSMLTELNPASSYYTLFHFNESLEDLGDKSISTSSEETNSFFLKKIGQPKLSTTENHSFFEILPDSGFNYQGFVLPESQGMISPFTLTLALKITNNQSKNILSYLSDDSSFGFSLYIDENSLLKLDILGLEHSTLNSGISIAALTERFLLSLSMIPDANNINIIWYINGKALSTAAFPWKSHPSSSQGVLTISGTDGFTGQIDELGIFYKDSSGRLTPDDQILKYSLQKTERLLMISGFDGFYLHEGLTLTGNYKLEKSLLSLGPMAALIFPTMNLDNQSINFKLKLFEILNNNGEILLSFGNQSLSNVKIHLADRVFLEVAGTKYPLSVKDKSLNLKISAEKIEFLSENEEETSLLLPSQNNNSLIISINNKAQYPLVIDSFTITR
ncbi:MAG: hypothetical protein JXR70_07060 [Spirochaetales bacterium]|nr:hypothetical protein [Spirochaetales bacterium]